MQTSEFYERFYTLYAWPTDPPRQPYPYNFATEGFTYIGG